MGKDLRNRGVVSFIPPNHQFHLPEDRSRIQEGAPLEVVADPGSIVCLFGFYCIQSFNFLFYFLFYFIFNFNF